MNFRNILLIVLSIFTISLQAQNGVVINEFSAANYDQFYDDFGNDEDWIELYNNTNTNIDLSGYYLSDKPDNPTKWQFPNGVSIGANDHLLIWASKRDMLIGNDIHTNFKITQCKGSEGVVLADPNGIVLDVHELDIPNQVTHSRGRITDGANTWGIFRLPTPGASNVNPILEYAQKPSINPAAGFYTSDVVVTIDDIDPNTTVHYTLDGSEPDLGSAIYTAPFTISNTTVVKAVAYHSDQAVPKSFTDYATFFINESHSVKVISIAGDGLDFLMNGDFNEPVGSFELFDETGDRVGDVTGEFNKHGNDSWAYNQRGIDFIARDQFGDDYAVKNELFDMFNLTNRDRFQRLIIKAGANDNYPFEFGGAMIRDAYVHTLSGLAGMEMDERTYEPCIMYVDGEYWGVYEIREKVDDHDFTDEYYNQDLFDIDFIKTWGGTWEEYGSRADWDELTAYIASNDMTDTVNYAWVEERLEVLSLIDYVILHAHIVSADWLNWNTAWWRGRHPDGEAKKWRYALWDEDATFGHYINYTGIPDQSANADPCDPEEIGFVDFEGHIEMFTDLLENEDFLALYINRYADLNNTFFSCDYMIPLLDSMIMRIAPEMTRHVDRWGGSIGEWEDNVQTLKDFIETRCTIIDDAIVDCYEDEGISGPFDVIINVQPEGAGRVKANTLIGENYPWATTYFGGIQLELTAIPNPGETFYFWEVGENTFEPNAFNEAITLSLESGDEITAFFSPEIPCEEPFGLVIDSTMTSVTLDWDVSNFGISWEVNHRKLGASEWEVLSILEVPHTIDGLDPCEPYELRLRTFCPTSVSAYANFDFITACSVGTNEIETGINSVQVNPNPFVNEVTVHLDLNTLNEVTVSLLTLDGRLVQRNVLGKLASGNHQYRFDGLDNLSNGLYLVRVATEHGVMVRKLVKQ